MKKLILTLFTANFLLGMGFSELATHNPLVEIPCREQLRKAFIAANLDDVAQCVDIYESLSADTQILKMHALSIIAGVDFLFEAWAIHNHESADFDFLRRKKGAVIRVIFASAPEWIKFAELRRLFDEVHVKNIYD